MTAPLRIRRRALRSKPRDSLFGRATLKGFPHGMPTTEAATINADLLAFIKK
jgi:hypothetical protein